MMTIFWNILGWADCGLNVLFGGSYLETCSSRLGRHYETSAAARRVADVIDWWAFALAGEMNHCKSNILLSSHYEGREVWK
jgi:hypothetical protein